MAAAHGMPGYHTNLTSGHSARIATAGWTGAPGSGTVQSRLHDFVKCALLQQLVPPGATVCDLYCGRGTDTEKWARAQIGRYVGVDFAASALEEAREQWDDHNRPYPADFCEVDPSMADLQVQLRHMGLPADFVCCMGHLQNLQDLFFNEDVVRKLLHNVASILKPGGYFFGITVDSSTIWLKYQKAAEKAIKAGSLRSNGILPRVNSEHYVISFEDDRFTPFGTKYTLQFADEFISHNQILVHFPSLIRLAEEVGLEFVEIQNLQEFYEDYRVQFFETLRATCGNLLDPKGKLLLFAYDVLSLYTTFIFKKADQSEPGFTLSPLPLADEDQMESYSEEAIDLNIAPQQEHSVLPDELNVPPRSLIQSSVHNHADETDGWGLGKDHRIFQELSTMQLPILGKGENGKRACSYDDRPLDRRIVNSIPLKESERTKIEDTGVTMMNESKELEASSQQFKPESESQTRHITYSSCTSKQSDECRGVNLEHAGKAGDANKRVEVRKGSMELPKKLQQFFDEVQQCHLDHKEKDQHHGVAQGFTMYHEFSQEHHNSVKSGTKSLLGDVKHGEESSISAKANNDPGQVADTSRSLQAYSKDEEPLMKDLDIVEPSKLDNAVSILDRKSVNQKENKEIELEEKSVGERQQLEISCNVEEMFTKNAEHREEHKVDMDSRSKDHAGSEDCDLTHAKDKMFASTKYDMAVVVARHKDSETDRYTYKCATRRTHTQTKEEPYTSHGRSSSEAAKLERSSRLNLYHNSQALGRSYHYSSHAEERKEQSQGSRHAALASYAGYHSRDSRDQRGEPQTRHVIPSYRSDDLRNWPQQPHAAASHVDFLHIATPQEFSFHQLPVKSPNTRGILGPGPPSLPMPETMRGLYSWQTSQDPRKRASSKDQSSCNLLTDHETSENKLCKDSPNRNWRDSPPPGTES